MMQTARTSDDFRSDTLREIARLRDEARVRLHLLSMHARQRWQILDDTLANFEEDLRRRGGNASGVIVAAAHNLTETAREFLNRQSNSIL
jgi:hypothetical protein